VQAALRAGMESAEDVNDQEEARLGGSQPLGGWARWDRILKSLNLSWIYCEWICQLIGGSARPHASP
jgi:hypothetical protein